MRSVSDEGEDRFERDEQIEETDPASHIMLDD
jgi:hypothetical protein